MSYLEEILKYEFTKSVEIYPLKTGGYNVVWSMFDAPKTIERDCIRPNLEDCFEFLYNTVIRQETGPGQSW